MENEYESQYFSEWDVTGYVTKGETGYEVK